MFWRRQPYHVMAFNYLAALKLRNVFKFVTQKCNVFEKIDATIQSDHF